ncbi:MAG: HAMP domain-containing sensor histidine kinase [Micropruina sp.]|uniref:sensor histidine kinase n=1 Tax=Micropruina sp. TaxID=2737536 RepID=UPI0039E328F0
MASRTQPARQTGRLPWLRTVRARVIAAVLALAALALTIAGLTAYTLESAMAERRVEGYLARAVDEFRVLACGHTANCTPGIDPTTGRPFTNPEDLIRVAMQRQVLAANESELGIVGSRVVWTAPEGVSFRPEQDPEFVNTVVPLAALDHVTRGRLKTAVADHSYAVTPVQFPNARGALVQTFDMRAEQAVLRGTYGTYALVALGSLLVVGFLIWLLVGRLLQPIRLLRTTAEDITEHDLSRRIPVHGDDDLSALTRTVNAMLDRLNAAMASQRQLLDDVGHELRTPVTIVRGHLELMDATDARDVGATRALSLDELDRMGRLVDDLLTLAKAERSDFLQPRPTDIGRLTDETLEKAHGLAPRRWLLDDLADTAATLDAQRVTQAWLQLASNAVKYSPADTPIALGSAVRDRELWLWVRDQGAGISAEERDLVLSRFGRGADAPLRADGTGLGLAIVDKIVTAHGGRVDIDSTLGTGSTIALVLPLRSTPAQSTPVLEATG